MKDCLFCKIATNQIAAKSRFEDADFVAFDDISPKASVHVLLIPKKHIHSIAALQDTDRELIGKMMLVARDLAKELNLKSYRIAFNSGSDAGQEVDHLHMHILGGNKLGPIA